jgi:hypothetical protein
VGGAEGPLSPRRRRPPSLPGASDAEGARAEGLQAPLIMAAGGVSP